MILFYDDESKWSMAAHYNRRRLLGEASPDPSPQPIRAARRLRPAQRLRRRPRRLRFRLRRAAARPASATARPTEGIQAPGIFIVWRVQKSLGSFPVPKLMLHRVPGGLPQRPGPVGRRLKQPDPRLGLVIVPELEGVPKAAFRKVGDVDEAAGVHRVAPPRRRQLAAGQHLNVPVEALLDRGRQRPVVPARRPAAGVPRRVARSAPGKAGREGVGAKICRAFGDVQRAQRRRRIPKSLSGSGQLVRARSRKPFASSTAAANSPVRGMSRPRVSPSWRAQCRTSPHRSDDPIEVVTQPQPAGREVGDKVRLGVGLQLTRQPPGRRETSEPRGPSLSPRHSVARAGPAPT